jgi:hypothetical protein
MFKPKDYSQNEYEFVSIDELVFEDQNCPLLSECTR